jgi:hypothetical protein
MGEGVRGIFFVHIMKTGGVTLTNLLRGHFGEAVYPPIEARSPLMKTEPTHLLGLPVEQREQFSVYSVHMPAWVAEAVAPGFHTVTVLREPVARTVSHLRQIAGIGWAPRDLEAIWDDPDWRLRLTDYQTRLLATDRPSSTLSPDQEALLAEMLAAHNREVVRRDLQGSLRTFYATAIATRAPLGPDALKRAERRLRDFDVVGVTERLELVAERLAGLIGIEPPALGRDNVASDRRPVPTSFLRRLEHDLTLDLELYETARTAATGSAEAWR